MVSCQHKHTHSEEADAHEGEEKGHSTEIVISPEQAHQAGIVARLSSRATSAELFLPEAKFLQHPAMKPQ